MNRREKMKNLKEEQKKYEKFIRKKKEKEKKEKMAPSRVEALEEKFTKC